MFQQPLYVSLSSTAENAVALDQSNPNAAFECVFSEPLKFKSPVDVAIRQLSLNTSTQSSAKNCGDVQGAYVLCNLVQASQRVGDTKQPILARVDVNQSNRRQTFRWPDMEWQRCAFTQFSRIAIRITTDSFQKSRGAAPELVNLHIPTADHPVHLQLAFRPSQPLAGSRVGIGGAS